MTMHDVRSAQERPDTATTHRRVMVDHHGRGGTNVRLPRWNELTGGPLSPATLALAAAVLEGRSALRLGDDAVAWREGALVWLRLDAPTCPVVLEHRSDAAALAGLPPAADPGTGRLVWAFLDQRAGEVAARAFVAPAGEEDAVGLQGAAMLSAALRRPLLVRLGTGSVVATRPAPRRRVEIGVRVVTAEPSPTESGPHELGLHPPRAR